MSGDEESTGTKSCKCLFNSVVDKLVLGVIAGIVLFLFEDWMANTRKEQAAKFSVAQINSTLIVSQIDAINAVLIKYFALVEQIKPFGIPTEDQKNNLRKLTGEVQISLFTAGTINEKAKQAGSPLLVEMVQLTDDLLTDKLKSKSDEIKNRLSKVRNAYGNVLTVLQQAAVQEVTKEYSLQLSK